MAKHFMDDLLFDGEAFVVSGWAFSQAGSPVEQIRYRVGEMESSWLALQRVARPDISKGFEIDEIETGFEFSLDPSAARQLFAGSQGEIVLNFGPEQFSLDLARFRGDGLHKRIAEVAAQSGRIALAERELKRAVACWLLVREEGKELADYGDEVLALISYCAVALRHQQDLLPTASFDDILARLKPLSGTDAYYFALVRLASAYGYDHEIEAYFNAQSEVDVAGNMQLAVIHAAFELKRYLQTDIASGMCPKAEMDRHIHTFKVQCQNLNQYSVSQIESVEKLCVLRQLLYRLWWAINGKPELLIRPEELTPLQQRIEGATFGLVQQIPTAFIKS
ncbi:hypothetical protein ED236_05225 [Pseudomethylobacillus aquaticus]|uniref:Uncharacterized protein n=1 Tax=Pseudomethylobacillus aquaticus TaxID=2676064 RepID=A0A3N0V3B6_9PROT|nr:hypothetical protein [Pseudomethylobacillus aquaticus]ROH87082.1 hypothetical protein ED236_05225 [Pseudomethylobacillus aquaticus]